MPPTHTAAIAANVRAEMARLKLPQSEIGRVLGISQQAISKRLAGEVSFSVEEIHAVASRLGVSTADLIDTPAARVAS